MSTKDKTTGATVKPAIALDKAYVLHNYVDFTVTANQLAQNETMDIFDIPANTMVLYALIRVCTADAQISDVDLGISGGTEDGFLDAADLSSTGWKTDIDEGYSLAIAAPYISTSAQIIRLTNKTAATLNDAKIHFYALCVDMTDADTGI